VVVSYFCPFFSAETSCCLSKNGNKTLTSDDHDSGDELGEMRIIGLVVPNRLLLRGGESRGV
jgi:hypothetical protein